VQTAILVPDMLKPVAKFRRPRFDQIGRRRSRTIVGHHDLEIRIGLARERTQNRVKRVFAVIGRDDDGNRLGHGRPL